MTSKSITTSKPCRVLTSYLHQNDGNLSAHLRVSPLPKEGKDGQKIITEWTTKGFAKIMWLWVGLIKNHSGKQICKHWARFPPPWENKIKYGVKDRVGRRRETRHPAANLIDKTIAGYAIPLCCVICPVEVGLVPWGRSRRMTDIIRYNQVIQDAKFKHHAGGSGSCLFLTSHVIR